MTHNVCQPVNPLLKTTLAKIGVLCVFLAGISCSAVKRVPNGQALLTQNTIYVNGEKKTSGELQNLLLQQPNSSVLGVPVRLHLYNAATENQPQAFEEWLRRKQKREERLKNFLSPKQVAELKNMSVGFQNWIKKTGEAPVIIDPAKTRKSLNRLRLYYEGKGFFNVQASYQLKTQEPKRAAVVYKVTTGNPYFLDTITTAIASQAIDSLYNRHRNNSFLKKGKQFNLGDFNAERNRLTALFLNSGIYGFQPQSIVFDIERDTLAEHKDYKTPVEVRIDNLIEQDANDSIQEIPYKIHKVKDVHIYIDANPRSADSLTALRYNNYTLYYKDKLRYRPGALTNSMAINPDSVYSSAAHMLTSRQLNSLSVFKYPAIQYSYQDSTQALLAAHIYLQSRPRFSLGFNSDISHSNIQDVGISFSSSLISRNIFRGAETLELSARGTIGASKEASNAEDVFFNISEIGADLRLNFPRFFFLFNTARLIPKYMSPETRISLGTTVQTNIGLDKQSVSGILRYTWNPDSFRKNAFELFNIQYVRNVNPDNFFRVYGNTYQRLQEVAEANGGGFDLSIPDGAEQFIADILANAIPIPDEDKAEVRRIEERKTRLTDNNLILAANFTHTRNNRAGLTDNQFFQLQTRVEVAGNALSLLAPALNLQKDASGYYQVFGVAYSQYVKAELDYIKYWALSPDDVLAFRSFLGIAVPYGNADNIPFSRSYFGGGSNDNRAWQAYSLGPGSTLALNDFNEANLKLTFNAEYRFGVAGPIKGALFADAGNIWNIWDNVTDEKATFNGFSSLADIALGSGFGVRYDFGFFVLRFDTGFKTYNPARTYQKWFAEYNFANAVFNVGINYPF